MNMSERAGAEYPMNYERPTVIDRIRRRGVEVGIAVLAVGAAAGLVALDRQQDARVEEIEACVEDRVNREVELKISPETDRIMKPAALYDAIAACQRSE